MDAIETDHVSGAWLQDQGQRRRVNQDAVIPVQILAPGIVFCGVLDGHGTFGGVAAYLVAELVQRGLSSAFASSSTVDKETVEATLRHVLHDANAVLLQVSREQRSSIQASDAFGDDVMHAVYENGTTCTFALVVYDTLYVVHVGDSRCYRITSHGIEQLTRDHSAADETERVRVEQEGGVVQRRGKAWRVMLDPADTQAPTLAMTRALGHLGLGRVGVSSEPEVQSIALSQDTPLTLLLCTDGIHDLLSPENLASHMSHTSPSTTVRSIANAALTHKQHDDNLALVFAVIHPIPRPE